MLLCCGEALIDMVPVVTADGEVGFVARTGGGALNTAIAMGRLGGRVSLLAGVSNDPFGDQLQQALRDGHVVTDYTIETERPTTLAFVTLREGRAQYHFHDENSAGRMIQPKDVHRIGPEVQALIFGGISLAMEPCGTTYETLCADMSAEHVILLDPNIRSNVVLDEMAYRQRLQRMIALSDVLKLSDEDLEWLRPASGDLTDQARALLALGPKLVVVTLGARGSLAVWGRGDVVQTSAPEVVVADTIGAGDTFNAGMVVALQETACLTKPALATLSKDVVEQVLTFATRAAAVTVTRSGANPPWRSDI